ncbi:MAG: diguanylate cyclase [Stappiaceae bacterium]
MAVTGKQTSSGNIKLVMYGLSALVIAVFAVTNLFMLHHAGKVADAVRHDLEKHVVKNEIQRLIENQGRDQAQISYYDESVSELGAEIEAEFVEEDIADWLWEDFGIETSVVVSVDGKARAAVFRDTIVSPAAADTTVADHQDLIKAAQQRYMQRRTAVTGGYKVLDNPVNTDNPLYVSGIRSVGGNPGIVIVQAIIPDDVEVLPDGPPQTFLTYKPFTSDWLAAIGSKLELSEFNIGPARGHVNGLEILPLEGKTGTYEFQADWRSASPARTIWRDGLPFFFGLLLIVGSALLLGAHRYGRALNSLKQSEEKNRFLALHDALTGLPNRLNFDLQLEKIISKGEQDRCAILCLDLDRFKSVNDTYGHQAGDTVIKAVSTRIAELVGSEGVAARIGGDEFIILLHDRLDRDHVLMLCDTIIESVCMKVDFEGGSACVGASIGVAWWPDDALTAKTVIRSADEALYRAKENGRGRAFLAGEPVAENENLSRAG